MTVSVPLLGNQNAWTGVQRVRSLMLSRQVNLQVQDPVKVQRTIDEALANGMGDDPQLQAKTRDLGVALFELHQDGLYSTDRVTRILDTYRACGDVSPFPGYTGLELVARGACGFVYRGMDESLRKVAIKSARLRTEEGQVRSLSSIQRSFEREWSLRERFNSPYIVKALKRDQTDQGKDFLVMEYMEGGTLRHWVSGLAAGVIPFDWVTTHQMIEGMLLAVTPLHEAGYVHRDIKPDNLFLTKDGEVRLADLELAERPEEEKIENRNILGTQGYMTPIVGTNMKNDIYALCIAAFELITGRNPFVKRLGLDFAYLQRKSIIRPSAMQPNIPEAKASSLDAWFLRGMLYNEKNHYRNAAAMLEDLQKRSLVSRRQLAKNVIPIPRILRHASVLTSNIALSSIST